MVLTLSDANERTSAQKTVRVADLKPEDTFLTLRRNARASRRSTFADISNGCFDTHIARSKNTEKSTKNVEFGRPVKNIWSLSALLSNTFHFHGYFSRKSRNIVAF